MKKIAILILAAGGSRRLGYPKQLLPYKGVKLVQYVTNECVASGVGDVYVVTGNESDRVLDLISAMNCKHIFNADWQEGQGTSLSTGVLEISKGKYHGVLIVLADQPFLTKDVLLNIQYKVDHSKPQIIKSVYQIGSGPPVYFDDSYFYELIQLKGDTGAKAIVDKHKKFVEAVSFPSGHIDIDNKEDLQYLK